MLVALTEVAEVRRLPLVLPDDVPVYMIVGMEPGRELPEYTLRLPPAVWDVEALALLAELPPDDKAPAVFVGVEAAPAPESDALVETPDAIGTLPITEECDGIGLPDDVDTPTVTNDDGKPLNLPGDTPVTNDDAKHPELPDDTVLLLIADEEPWLIAETKL